MTDNQKLTAAFNELEYEDEAFGELEKALQRKVATGVTDGTLNAHRIIHDLTEALRAAIYERNAVLEEVAKEFDHMTSLGDTAASFAAYVRGMKG
jgi:predicted methyltransferase MtxX (methanogen marker protein 4)